MRSFEIFVDQGSSAEHAPRGEASLAERRGGAPRGPAPREVLDIFIQGTNVTASVNERNAVSVLRDLASALTPLLASHRGKAIVRFYDDSWELAIERFGPTALLSVYRAGGDPKVLVHERPVAFSEVRASVLDALANAAGAGAAGSMRSRAPELETVRRSLADTEDLGADSDLPLPRPTPVVIELDRDAPISFAAEFLLREGARGAAPSSVERADLHALLFRGRMRAEIRGRAVDLGEAAPFLVAERLVELARGALASWERGQGFHVRANAGGLLVGLRASCDADGREVAALVLGSAELSSRERALYTFPNLGVSDVVEAALSFGRAVVRAVVRRDRSQSMNLRLSAFRRQVRELEGALREVKRSDSFVNRAPESYRAFAEGAARPRSEAVPPARLRYTPKWRAQIAGIDLRGTFLCGDRLIVGSVHELSCLDRATGEVLWRAPAARATSVVTPAGIARVASDGEVTVHDFGNGDVALRTWIAPRGAGPQAGCVVSAPGLPRLLILSEGERHLVALDLLTGEPRWRYAWGKSSGALRLKRSGKLLYVATGDTALTALDVSTGSVVWRVRDRLRFCAAPTVDQHGLYAVAGAAHGPGQLAIVDPFSGEVRVSHALTGTVTVEGSPLVASDAVVLALLSLIHI